MEESQEVNQHNHEGEPAPTGINRAILVVAAVLLVVAVMAVGYGYRQQVMVGHLTAQGSAANATINDMQGQLSTLTAKLNDMSAAQQAAADSRRKAQAYAEGVGARLGRLIRMAITGRSSSSRTTRPPKAAVPEPRCVRGQPGGREQVNEATEGTDAHDGNCPSQLG